VDKTSLGNRIKNNYENVFAYTLPKRIPVIIRVDGRAFHTFTRSRFGKGYSEIFMEWMAHTAIHVQKELQGCSFAYGQSDEISFLLTDYKTIRTQPCFDYDLRKLISISASKASAVFSRKSDACVTFDSRAFSIPQDEVCNYFIWRQQDATRNAIQMLGQNYFSHKLLHKKSCDQIQELLYKKEGINFNDCPTIQKRGYCVINNILDEEIPIFSLNRNYTQQFVYIRED
jgi:tRNA(His) 5'-end guanylyltransferase